MQNCFCAVGDGNRAGFVSMLWLMCRICFSALEERCRIWSNAVFGNVELVSVLWVTVQNSALQNSMQCYGAQPKIRVLCTVSSLFRGASLWNWSALIILKSGPEEAAPRRRHPPLKIFQFSGASLALSFSPPSVLPSLLPGDIKYRKKQKQFTY